MKKILTFSAALLMCAAAPAYADNHGDKAGKLGKYDANGDGVISKAEFLAQAEKRFAQRDIDGNGEISRDEMKAARQDMKEKMQERHERKRF